MNRRKIDQVNCGGWLGGGRGVSSQLRSLLSALSQLHSLDPTRPGQVSWELKYLQAGDVIQTSSGRANTGIHLLLLRPFPARQLAIIVFSEILASSNCRLVSPSFLIIIRFLPSDNSPQPGPVCDTVNLLVYFETKCKILISASSFLFSLFSMEDFLHSV